MAALMPPAAATECERTGWTLLMIATDAPASAAASAARCPARPAPRMRTSCAGMSTALRLEVRGPGLYRSGSFRPAYVEGLARAADVSWTARGSGRADARRQRAAHALQRQHPAEPAVAVDD